MVEYTKPQHRKKEESEQLRGERETARFTYYCTVDTYGKILS